jgi:hypothetical protein
MFGLRIVAVVVAEVGCRVKVASSSCYCPCVSLTGYVGRGIESSSAVSGWRRPSESQNKVKLTLM